LSGRGAPACVGAYEREITNYAINRKLRYVQEGLDVLLPSNRFG
jgi:hypothetical protein